MQRLASLGSPWLLLHHFLGPRPLRGSQAPGPAQHQMSAWSPLSHLFRETFLGHPPPPLLAPLRFWGGSPLRAVTPSSNLKTLPHNPKNWTAPCRPATAFHCACGLGVRVHRAAGGLLAVCVLEQEPPSAGKGPAPLLQQSSPRQVRLWPHGELAPLLGPGQAWTLDQETPLAGPRRPLASGPLSLAPTGICMVPPWSPAQTGLPGVPCPSPCLPPALQLLCSVFRKDSGREGETSEGRRGHPCSPTPAAEHSCLCSLRL